MAERILKVGSRGSRLSQIQTAMVIALFAKANPTAGVESVIIKTEGDRDLSSPLGTAGRSGTFTQAIEEALLKGAIDIAVHSAKDLPSKSDERLEIAAVPERGPCEDAWLSSSDLSFQQLSPGSKVGTSSPRRQAMLLNLRSDLIPATLRGNVETRIRSLREGKYDAIILAKAGLARLDLDNLITTAFPPETFIPAPGQGALAVQIRADDTELWPMVRRIDHAESHRCLDLERGLLRKLNAACDVAVGGWVRYAGRTLRMSAAVLSRDGRKRIDAAHEIAGDAYDDAVEIVFQQLASQGAIDMIKEYGSDG